jgi:hypothetical protein
VELTFQLVLDDGCDPIAELLGVTVAVPDARHLSLQFMCGEALIVFA